MIVNSDEVNQVNCDLFVVTVLRWLKPGVSIKTHLLSASLIWTVVGGGLLWVGVGWALPIAPLWLLALALSLGTLKSLYILDRIAEENSTRIKALPENSCIGGVYSLRTWLLVVVMVVLGRLLRTSTLSREYLGLLYFIVGFGLLLSSRIVWRDWRRHREQSGEQDRK